MSNHLPHRRPARPWRSRVAAALTATAVGSAGFAVFGGSASALPVSELDLSWTGAPASVGNGEPVRGVAHVNLNDHLGEEGAASNHVVTFTAADGVFTRLPSACRTDGDPASAVTAGGSSVRCNLGPVRFGTAIEVDFTVTAHAADGGAVRVEVTDGTTSTSLPPVPVTAAPGIDVVFNEAQRIQANTAWHSTFPVAIALPAGAADLRGPISFDVVVANKTSTNAPAAITPTQGPCVPLASSTAPSSMPYTSSQAPMPDACTISQTAPGVFHVQLTGYRSGAALNPPTTAADGSNLPPDRHVFAAFGLPMTSSNGVLPATSSFELSVKRTVATTTSGTAVTESDLSNNTEAVAITVPGGYAHNWAHPDGFAPPMDSRVVGGGGPWAASYYATPGDQLITNSTNGIWGGQPASAIPARAEWSTCEVLDGPASFTGDVIPNLQPTSATDIAALPAGTYSWSVYTGPLPAAGSRAAFDCGSVNFTPVSYVVLNHAGDDCRCTEEQHLSVSDPASITAIKLTVDPAKLAAASPLSTTPTRVGMHAAAKIAQTATPSDAVWTIGSATDRTGVWKRSSDLTTLNTRTPGLSYPGTDSLRDVMRILGARPYVHKTVSQPDVRAGDVVTYSLHTGADANLGAGSATWTLTDEMPAGVDYVDGSASRAPDSVVHNADGSTRLVWTQSGPVNVDTEISYRGRISFTEGVRRNTVIATVASGPATGNAGVETAEDSADVAYAGDGRTLLTKSAGSPTFAAGGTDTWRLDLANLDTVDQAQTDTIDVLPWNGDARGTAFHGTYEIDSVTASPGDRVYYATAAPASISTDPNAGANGSFASPSPMWSSTPPTDPSSATAIRIVGGVLPVGATRSNTITWHPVGGRRGDRFENIAYAKATHTRLQMIKAAAASTVTDGSSLQIAKKFESADGWMDGDTLHYTVTVRNPSASTARGVRVHDLGGPGNDPASVRFANMSAGAFDPGTRTWVIGDLAPGRTVTSSLTTTITVGADRTKPFQNLAYVENPSNPYQPTSSAHCQRNNQDVGADTDQCDVAEVSSPRLRIDKHADGVTADGTVTWTIHVRVDGTVGARDVRVEDTYPAGLDRSTLRVTHPPTQGTFDLARNTWTVGDLGAGVVASVSFRGRVRAAPGTRIVNVASVDSPDVTPPAPVDGGPICQANDGPTVDAALDADTDQCDEVQTVLGPPRDGNPRPTPPSPERLPDTGGPSGWVGLLGGASAVGAIGLRVTGRRTRASRDSRDSRGSHRG
ncbi:hypothetical protein Back2_01560 [Nocardioides baekrokdamisoli]|uniref:DUF11 domain-containing protein n=1 Tax=Nocardioides baekrokdamisoli TaxID=1804624 RepID=A0A3G9IYT9_9ACTN|nr:DUF11 domain-containing protein [Nocardioides baekrokdamisoli]BBH15869.1 hypothetical protein Back2_01560 [Nocardioides baekrokdamisoli]